MTQPDRLFRAALILVEVTGDGAPRTLEDAGLLVRDGRVIHAGPFAELARDAPGAKVIGDGTEIILPGFVNAHHPVGLTALQLGSPDMPLELWFATRLVCRAIDLHLDTLHSAFDMIASGMTTVQHLHGWLPGDLFEAQAGAGRVRMMAATPARTHRAVAPHISLNSHTEGQPPCAS